MRNGELALAGHDIIYHKTLYMKGSTDSFLRTGGQWELTKDAAGEMASATSKIPMTHVSQDQLRTEAQLEPRNAPASIDGHLDPLEARRRELKETVETVKAYEIASVLYNSHFSFQFVNRTMTLMTHPLAAAKLKN
jgi:hypothetical protein